MAITRKDTIADITHTGSNDYSMYERKSIKGFFRYETSDQRTVTQTEVNKGVYLNFIVYYYWYSTTACDLIIGWEPGYYDSENSKYARYTSTLSTLFHADSKIQLKLNGSTLTPFDGKNNLYSSRMLTTSSGVVTPLAITSSSFAPAWIGRITGITSDIKNLEITFKYSNTIQNTGYTLTGLINLTERNKIKINKPSRYEHNVVFNEEGLNELIDNIKKYPIINIETVADTQWDTVSNGQPSIKIIHGNPNFGGTDINYKYIKVGSNIKFINPSNNSEITSEASGTQQTGTFRVKINNKTYEVPIKGLAGGSGAINFSGSLVPTIDSQPSSGGGYNLGSDSNQWNILYARGAVFGNADEQDGKSDAASNIRPYEDGTGSIGTNDCRWGNIYGNSGRFRTLVIHKKDPIEAGKFGTILSIYHTDAYNGEAGKVYEGQDIIHVIGTGLNVDDNSSNSSYAFGSKAGTTCLIAGEACQPTIQKRALYNNENIYLLADNNIHFISGNYHKVNDAYVNGWDNTEDDNTNITSVTINTAGNLIVNKGNIETSQGSVISHRFLSLYTYPDYGTSERANIYYKKQASTTSTSEYGTGRFYTNKDFEANKVYGAVFNDYAEYRTTINLTPGHVVVDQDDGSLACSSTRLQPGAQVISDTFGHSMGETDTAKTPLAVAGRVLVYTYQSRENYHAGMAVCSAPDGTVDIMTREEIRDYPDCIVGIVSEIPQYETWGSDNVKVDGRIWIKVK